MSKEQYVKLDEVTEMLSGVLCIPDFYSRNILESDVSEAYNKIISLERVEIERGNKEDKGTKEDGDLTLKEIKQMCEGRDCGDCSFRLSCHRLFKGMPSQWSEYDLNEKIYEGKG